MRRSLVLAVALLGAASWAQVWERTIQPGMTYRMEVRRETPLLITAIRFDPRHSEFYSESHAARGFIYDATPTNGRDTVSAMVSATEAIAGINGDFFQFGEDPGGDPTNIMLRNGELLSEPNTEGRLITGFGWGPGFTQISTATWEASVLLPGGRSPRIDGLNRYTREGELVLNTDSAGYAVSKIGANFFVFESGRYSLAPESRLRGRLVQVVAGEERIPVRPGTFVLGAAGEKAEALRAVALGDEVTVSVAATGFDWARVRNIMGGGPLLVRSGKIALEPDEPRHPRTAVGVDAEGGIWYVLIDGRQSMSRGTTLFETAQIMKELGCVHAMNLDGGGSSTLHALGVTLNRPSSGQERAVANAVLWYGPRPAPTEGLSIAVPELALHPGVEFVATVPGVPAGEVIWSCQGSAWVDGDGRVRCLAEGAFELTALVRGTSARVKLTVLANP